MKQQMQNSGLWLATGRLGNAEPCVPERPPQGTSGSLGTEWDALRGRTTCQSPVLPHLGVVGSQFSRNTIIGTD